MRTTAQFSLKTTGLERVHEYQRSCAICSYPTGQMCIEFGFISSNFVITACIPGPACQIILMQFSLLFSPSSAKLPNMLLSFRGVK